MRGSLADQMRKAANRKRRERSRRRHGAQHTRATSAHINGKQLRRKRRAQRPGLSGFATGLLQSVVLHLSAGARAGLNRFAHVPASVARTLAIAPEDREIAALLLAPFFFLAVLVAGNHGAQMARKGDVRTAIPVPPSATSVQETRTLVATNLPGLRAVSINDLVPSIVTISAGPTLDAIPAEHPGNAIYSRTDNRQVDVVSLARAPLSSARVVTAKAFSDEVDTGSSQKMRPNQKARALIGLHPIEKRSRWRALVAMQPAAGVDDPASPLVNQVPLNVTKPNSIAQVGVTGRVNADAALPSSNAKANFAVVSATPLAPVSANDFRTLTAHSENLSMADATRGLFERCALPGMTSGATSRPTPPTANATWFGGTSTLTFGERLAKVARRQVNDLVIYDASYQRIAYPRGDVPKFYGVCSDVIIRAYRDMGIDLQVAVHKARVGSGDTNIDHRRTETLRRFFSLSGERLPVSSFSEDYLPGDIVTYARPQNLGSASRSHIAMVTDLMAPSGRPLIIHNRGWGPQLEDALFVDEITGHYRYYGEISLESADNIRPLEPRLLKKRQKGETAATLTRARVTLLPRSRRRAHLRSDAKRHARSVQVGSSAN